MGFVEPLECKFGAKVGYGFFSPVSFFFLSIKLFLFPLLSFFVTQPLAFEKHVSDPWTSPPYS